MNQQKVKHLVVSGPSGVGKGTILSHLYKNYPQYFQLSVSYTTRNIRPGEEHGKHYYYVDESKFQEEIKKDNFLEYCQVHQHLYGTHLSEVQKCEKQGKICILEIDVQGAEKVYKHDPKLCNHIFISPPTIDHLKQRLLKRLPIRLFQKNQLEEQKQKNHSKKEWEMQKEKLKKRKNQTFMSL